MSFCPYSILTQFRMELRMTDFVTPSESSRQILEFDEPLLVGPKVFLFDVKTVPEPTFHVILLHSKRTLLGILMPVDEFIKSFSDLWEHFHDAFPRGKRKFSPYCIFLLNSWILQYSRCCLLFCG